MRIAVVGNAAGGKTKLSRKLGERYSIGVTHIDSIQFLPGMIIRPHAETIKTLRTVALKQSWIIDGYGPLDIIEERFLIADHIIFIDLPVWRHLLWAVKRQFENIFKKRAELPENCNEQKFSHFKKLLKSIWVAHQKMRPELLKIFNREHLLPKLIWVRSLSDLKKLSESGI